MRAPREAGATDITPLNRLAVFAAGFFSLSQIPMMTLIVPLWAADIGAGPLWIGIAVSLRAALAMFFSIQAGALMDRLGTARVCGALGVAAALLALAYPLWPSIAGLLLLQTVLGFLHVTCWIGAQAMIGTLAGGNPGTMGRFTFVTTLGTFLGPLLVGLVWEFLGPWGAFALVSGWSLAFALIATATSCAGGAASGAPVRPADLVPKWADYMAGFGLLRSPIVACFMVISSALAATYAMRHTFLSAYLDGIAFQGTEIGIIFGSMALSGGVAGLTVGYLSRYVRPHWLTIAATMLGALSFSTLPLFTGFWPLLVVSLATGICTGLAFPLVLSILTREISIGDQGLSAGLRSTTNRTASLTIPVIMGAVIAATDMAFGFFVMGAVVICIVAAPVPFLVRALRRANRS